MKALLAFMLKQIDYDSDFVNSFVPQIDELEDQDFFL